MAEYVAFCGPRNASMFGDVVGTLLVKTPKGWRVVAQHLSSNPSWSLHDLTLHYQRRDDPTPYDTIKWLGQHDDIDKLLQEYPIHA